MEARRGQDVSILSAAVGPSKVIVHRQGAPSSSSRDLFFGALRCLPYRRTSYWCPLPCKPCTYHLNKADALSCPHRQSRCFALFLRGESLGFGALWTAESLPPAEDRPAMMTKPVVSTKRLLGWAPFGEYSRFFNFCLCLNAQCHGVEKAPDPR
jgi:hypothetical protein